MAGATDTVLFPRGRLGPCCVPECLCCSHGRHSAVLACIPGRPQVASSQTRLLPFPVPHCGRREHRPCPPEGPSRESFSACHFREATLPQVVFPMLWAGLCPSPEAHVNLQTSECGCIRARAFANMIRPWSSVTGVLISRDQDADTRRDPCGPHEDPGRRRLSARPGDASGGTDPAAPGWGAYSLQDVRAHSRCVRLPSAVSAAPPCWLLVPAVWECQDSDPGRLGPAEEERVSLQS